MTNEVGTTMLDKMLAVKEQSQTIGEFLDWIMYETDYCLMEERTFVDDRGVEFGMGEREVKEWLPARISIERLLAKYFDIDLDQAHKEQDAELKQLIKLNKERAEKDGK